MRVKGWVEGEDIRVLAEGKKDANTYKAYERAMGCLEEGMDVNEERKKQL